MGLGISKWQYDMSLYCFSWEAHSHSIIQHTLQHTMPTSVTQTEKHDSLGHLLHWHTVYDLVITAHSYWIAAHLGQAPD